MNTLFNFESATEVARLFLQDRLLQTVMQGELIFQNTLPDSAHILDIGSGPGGWAIDVARTFPHCSVVGIDSSPTMIAYASSLAMMHGLKNCQFTPMDALKPLAISDQDVHLVTLRTMGSVVPKKAWPALLQECYRVTHPGGILQLLEFGEMTTKSSALETFGRFCTQLLSQRGYGVSPDGSFGMSPQRGEHLLLQAGYQKIAVRSFHLDFSAGTPFHTPQKQCLEGFFTGLQAHLIQSGVATRQEIENLHAAVSTDLASQSFHGILLFHVVWGEKA